MKYLLVFYEIQSLHGFLLNFTGMGIQVQLSIKSNSKVYWVVLLFQVTPVDGKSQILLSFFVASGEKGVDCL